MTVCHTKALDKFNSGLDDSSVEMDESEDQISKKCGLVPPSPNDVMCDLDSIIYQLTLQSISFFPCSSCPSTLSED